MLPKKYAVISNRYGCGPISRILDENGYTEIIVRDTYMKNDFFLVGRKYDKEYMMLSYPWVKYNSVYTPIEIFHAMEMPTRLREYSPEEIINLEKMIRSNDENIQYMGISMIAKMHPKYIDRFIRMCPYIFYYTHPNEDDYIRILKEICGPLIWGGLHDNEHL